jgi:hypothetical protein
MKRYVMTAVALNGERRVVHEFVKKPRHASWTIFRIDYNGQPSSCELGARTLRDTKLISANIARSQRFTDIKFESRQSS